MVRSSGGKLGIAMQSSAMTVCATTAHLERFPRCRRTQVCPHRVPSPEHPIHPEHPQRRSNLRLKAVMRLCIAVRTAARCQPGSRHRCRVSNCHLRSTCSNRRRMHRQFPIFSAGQCVRTSTTLRPVGSAMRKLAPCRGALRLVASDRGAMVTTATHHCRSSMAKADR